jgi:hypothetical protein
MVMEKEKGDVTFMTGWCSGKKPMFAMFSLDIFVRLVLRIIITGGVREISDLLCKVVARGWSSY